MSDKDEFRYDERSPDELRELESTFRSRSTGGANYVAKPADGWDKHGAWHCFDTGSRTGYAAHAVALHWALDRHLKICTQLVPHRNLDIDIERFPPDRGEMLFDWHKNAVGVPHVLFCSFPPEVAAELAGGATPPPGISREAAGMGPPIVPYCAFEGDKVSSYCRDLCNGDAFSEVWVVSNFVKKAMVAGGVLEDRVHVVPPAICGGPWKIPSIADSLSLRDANPEFTFGYMGTWHARKGMLDLIRAYFGTFKRDESVRLTIRTSAFGKMLIRELKEEVLAAIAKVAKEFGDDDFPASRKQPKLTLELGTDLSDQDVVTWLSSLDAYANASYGEGLGIPAMWSKAAGVPMVTTAYGAVGEFITSIPRSASELSPDALVPFWHRPVDAEMLRIGLMFDPDTRWSQYDPAQFGSKMRSLYERGQTVDEAGAAAAMARFSVESMAARVSHRIAERGWNL